MKNYRVTIHLTRAGETEIKEAEFGGKNPDESLSYLMEMAFDMGRDPEVENFSIITDEIEEFTAAAPAPA